MNNTFSENMNNAVSIVFVHYKGGTGKTTSCLNIAGWLTKLGKKVLVIDLDPQGNATSGLGVDKSTLSGSIYDTIFGQKDIEEIILETESGIYLAPSCSKLLFAETYLAKHSISASHLKENISHIEEYFDYILVDVPPGSSLLTVNGISACDNIIIPLDSGVFAYETLDILKTLVIDIQKELGIESNIMMMLLRKNPLLLFRDSSTRDVMGLMKRFLDENCITDVDIHIIPFSNKIHKAQMKGLPISHYAPYSSAGRAFLNITKKIVADSE